MKVQCTSAFGQSSQSARSSGVNGLSSLCPGPHYPGLSVAPGVLPTAAAERSAGTDVGDPNSPYVVRSMSIPGNPQHRPQPVGYPTYPQLQSGHGSLMYPQSGSLQPSPQTALSQSPPFLQQPFLSQQFGPMHREMQPTLVGYYANDFQRCHRRYLAVFTL
jgi:hypothetical protein